MNERILDKRQKNHRILRRLVMAGSLLAEQVRRTDPTNTDMAEVWDSAVEDLRNGVLVAGVRETTTYNPRTSKEDQS